MASNDTVVRITADATGYTAALERARQSASSFIASQEAAAARTAAAQQAIEEATSNASQASARQINAFIQSLGRQADAAGKTRAELLQMQAAALGVSGSAQQYIDRIADASQHTEELSFKTAGARRELLVLAHEASQGNWKNFGGSLLVLGERIDAMSLIFSATGVAAAALAGSIAAIAVAAIKGAEEAKQFNAALELTNNFAGLTRDSFAAMAEAVSGNSGASLGKSHEVLLDLAQSGKLTSDEMQNLASVILRTADISGQKLEEVEKEYDKLAEDPAKWASEHNASMHFMDVATYQHIQALQEAGDRHKAIQAVIEATAAQVENSSTVHLSAAARAWDNLSSSVQTFWQKLKQGLSTGASLQDQIDTLTGERSDIQGNLFSAGRVAEIDNRIAALKRLQRAQADNAALQSANAQQQQTAIEAVQRIDRMRDQLMNNAERREKELAQLAKDRKSILNAGGTFSDAQYAQMVADINSKYKDPKQKKPKALQDDSGTRMLQSLRDQQAALEAQLSSTTKLTNAESELAKFEQQISDWKNKTLTPQQQSLMKDQNAIRAQLQKNVELEKEVQHRNDLAKLQERAAQLDESMASYQKGQTDQYGRQLDAFGMGSEALKNVEAVKSIYSEYQRLQEQLDKATPRDLLGGADYTAASAKIKAGLQQSLDDYDTYYASLKQKQGDWENGFSAGFQNYLDLAHNVATQAQGAFTDATKGMEDALVKFATTGKLSFTDLANSIISDIIRIQARAAAAGLLESIASAFGGSVAGGLGSFDTTGSAAASSAAVMNTGYVSTLSGPSSLMSSYASLPARASGGAVNDGTAYLVGEMGPEVFVPGQSGSIIANRDLAGSGVSSVKVEIVNQGSQQSQVKSATPKLDASGMVIRIVLDDLQKGGPVRSAIQNLPKP